ncbi:MAG: hypothetical protein K6G10_10420 [Butyrivibrio sp.]|nr:hypothetical protein [Butyrivibrio sp.]
MSAESSDETNAGETAEAPSEDTSSADGEKILHTAASFAYPSLDVHKEYYGWYTSIYGISEALFKLDEAKNYPQIYVTCLKPLRASMKERVLLRHSHM